MITTARASVVLFTITLALAVVLAVLAHVTPGPLPGDERIAGAIQSIHSNAFAWLMAELTLWGANFRFPLLILAAVLTLLIAHRDLAALFVALSSSSSVVLEAAVKAIVGRPRPQLLPPLAPPFSYFYVDTGFPSGHALHTTVFYGVLAFLWYCFSSGWRRWLGIPIAVVVVLLTGISRIYLGVHWSSDVLGGYLIGGLWLSLFVAAYLRLARRDPANACHDD